MAVILTVATLNAYAEEPVKSVTEVSQEAFLRGGTAISEALRTPSTPASLVSANLVPPAPTQPAMPAPPQEGKHRRTMLWIGLAVTGTIAVYLIQRSVRNHGKIFGDNT